MGCSPSKLSSLAGVDGDGNTPLHIAARRHNEKTVKLLLRQGADINSRNYNEETPLHQAAGSHVGIGKDVPLKMIKYLIEQGADPFAKDKFQKTFLHIYFAPIHTISPTQAHHISEYIVKKGLAELFNSPDKDLYTPLYKAVWSVQMEESTISLLTKSGVNFNAVDYDGNSILFWAVNGNRNKSYYSTLIKFGANWRHTNKKQQNILHKAASYNDMRGLELFLSYGELDINAVDSDGNAPLHLALVYYRSENIYQVIQLLVGNGANVNLCNKKGESPLAMALNLDPDWSPHGNDRIVELLKSELQNGRAE